MVEDEVSEGFKDWEQIQSPRLQSSNEWSMVMIRDSLSHDCSVFPPINHEGLHISSQHNHQNQATPQSSSSPSPLPCLSSFSPSDDNREDPLSSSPSDENREDPPSSSSPSDSRIRLPGDVSRWLGIGLEVLRSKVFGIVSSFRHYAATRGAVWSFASVAGMVTAVLLSLLYMRVWRRRNQRCWKESRDHLMLLIKEKDEKIVQLLHQVAQMNEALLARHRVP